MHFDTSQRRQSQRLRCWKHGSLRMRFHGLTLGSIEVSRPGKRVGQACTRDGDQEGVWTVEQSAEE